MAQATFQTQAAATVHHLLTALGLEDQAERARALIMADAAADYVNQLEAFLTSAVGLEDAVKSGLATIAAMKVEIDALKAMNNSLVTRIEALEAAAAKPARTRTRKTTPAKGKSTSAKRKPAAAPKAKDEGDPLADFWETIKAI